MWKKAFDAMEKSVAPQLEKAIRTDQFADAASALTKVQAQMQKRAEKASRDALHRANMPAATDVKRLADQMASLERRMHEISKQQHEILDLLRMQAEDGSAERDEAGGSAAARRRPKIAAVPPVAPKQTAPKRAARG